VAAGPGGGVVAADAPSGARLHDAPASAIVHRRAIRAVGPANRVGTPLGLEPSTAFRAPAIHARL
jgi:hypothetical protein